MFRRHSDLDNDLAHCLPFKLDRSRVDTVLLYFPLAVIISFSTSRVCRTTHYLLTGWNEFRKRRVRESEREKVEKKSRARGKAWNFCEGRVEIRFLESTT